MIWKNIDDCRLEVGRYQVSDTGLIKDAKKDRLVPQRADHRGYKRVCLSGAESSNIRVTLIVHIVVAKAFIQNNDASKTQIDHIDGDPANNVVGNLRWVTRKENINNPITVARQHIARYKSSVKCPVLCVTTGELFPTAKAASEHFGIPMSSLSLICTAAANNDVDNIYVRKYGLVFTYLDTARDADIDYKIEDMPEVVDYRANPVKCVELGTVYASVHLAAKVHHRDPTTIRQSCQRSSRSGMRFNKKGANGVYHFEWAKPEEYYSYRNLRLGVE